MKKLKVCRKLVAFILTLCMVLPLISNQYFVVHAEEASENGEISYQDVPALDLGENSIQTDVQKVTYLNEDGVASAWSGNVFRYTVPDTGNYVAGMTYSGNSVQAMQTMECYEYTDGKMVRKTGDIKTWLYRTEDAFLFLLENGKTYYFLLRYNNGSETVTKKEAMQDLSIFIRNDIPSVTDIAQYATTIDKATTDQIQEKDKRFIRMPDLEEGVYRGKAYKITLPDNTKVAINVGETGFFNVIELTDQVAYGYSFSFDLTLDAVNDGVDSRKGVLANDSGVAKTYYVFVVGDARTAEFGAITNQPEPTPIKEGKIKELTLGGLLKLSELSTQRLSYDKLLDRGETKDTSTIQLEKSEGNWAKVTVPEDKVYYMNRTSTGRSNLKLFRYVSGWDVYEEWLVEEQYATSEEGNVALSGYSLQPGTYYMCGTGETTVELFEISSAATLVGSAVEAEVTDSDIKKGTKECKSTEKKYKFVNLYGNTDCGFGAMLKCSVPANTTYLIGCNEGKAYVYTDETLNTCVSDSGVLQNNSSEPKVFYIWVNTRYAVGACTLKLTFDDTVMDLTTAVKSAESLTDGDKTVFCWNDKDSGYIPCLTTINSTYPIQYKAKVYKLEKGLHKLTVHADKENVVPKLTMFETGDLFQTNLWTFEDVELANTWTTEVDVYDTAYLVLDADESNLDAEITLSLTKSDAKKVLDAKEEITKLEVGENPNTADINSYVFIIHSEDNVSGKDYDCYGACTGRWYSYTVPAYTKATITLPANGNYYLFGEDSGMYDLGEAYVPRDVEYENETDKPEMIYVALEGESDSTASIIVKTTKTREEANLLSAYKEKANELPKNQMVEIGESDAQLTAKVPQQYGEDDEKTYIEETGYLYKLQVAAKSKVEISASNARAVRIYSDPDALPVVSDEDGKASFSNLANEEKTFYIWWNGTVGASIKAAESTLDTTTTPKEDGGSKTETTIDTEVEDAKITVAEDKNSSEEVTEAVVKVEQTGGISADAIKKSIETVEQYNSDNAGKKQVTNIQATYKDASNAIISADVLISLKKAEISLELSKKTEDGTLEYAWDFDAESLKKTDIKEEINTKLEVFKDAVNYDDKVLVDNLTDPEVSKCVVAFEHNGDLPNDTKVTVPVNQYSNGTTVYYYHINKEKNALEIIADSKVTNGMVTLTLSHCSDYVMYDRKVCTHEETKIVNAVKESCTKEGYTGDTYCSDCDKKLAEGKKIPMTDHTSSDWIVDRAATVDAAGSRHKECTVCHKVLKTEEIAKLPKPEPTPAPVVTPDVTTRYTTHVQSIGWQGDENNTAKWFTNGKMAGTSGRAKRLEGIKLRVDGNDKLGIQYTTHCQSYGWLPWSANGEMNGTEGEAKRLEAIKIQLTGADKEKYDVYYRVHAQSYGWLGWAKNGEPAGTAGYAKRLEGIQIVVVKKDTAAPGLNYAGVNAASGVHQTKTYIAKAGSSPVVGNTATSNENPKIAGDTTVNVAYRTHVQSYGWQGWKYNGQMSGTSGKAKRLEGINIKLTNKPYSGSIVYTTHVQSFGWQGDEHNQNTWMHDGQMAGTSGKAKRLEAIRINLTGEMAKHYDIYYRVHAQSFGWMNWTKNGEPAGTAGLAKRLEGIQIVIVPKGGAAPAANYGNVVSVRSQAYIKR